MSYTKGILNPLSSAPERLPPVENTSLIVTDYSQKTEWAQRQYARSGKVTRSPGGASSFTFGWSRLYKAVCDPYVTRMWPKGSMYPELNNDSLLCFLDNFLRIIRVYFLYSFISISYISLLVLYFRVKMFNHLWNCIWQHSIYLLCTWLSLGVLAHCIALRMHWACKHDQSTRVHTTSHLLHFHGNVLARSCAHFWHN